MAPPQRGRRRSSRPALLPVWVPAALIVFVCATVTIGGFALGAILADDMTPKHPTAASASPSPTRSITPSPTADPVAAARRLQPLEDLHPGDRVLYRGTVCTWRSWRQRVATSTIVCKKKTLDVTTARLTPVETTS